MRNVKSMTDILINVLSVLQAVARVSVGQFASRGKPVLPFEPIRPTNRHDTPDSRKSTRRLEMAG